MSIIIVNTIGIDGHYVFRANMCFASLVYVGSFDCRKHLTRVFVFFAGDSSIGSLESWSIYLRFSRGKIRTFRRISQVLTRPKPRFSKFRRRFRFDSLFMRCIICSFMPCLTRHEKLSAATS